MKLISYVSTRKGPLMAAGSVSVRIGTNSPFSHTELLFEPGDGVEEFIPDRILQPIEGAYWCASASSADPIPDWSEKRKGRTGGVRLKRIKIKQDHWIQQDLPKELFDPILAMRWFKEHEGLAYDWRHIFSFVGFIFNRTLNHGYDKYTCTEAVASALGFSEPERFHPGNFPAIIHRMTVVDPYEWKKTKELAQQLANKSWNRDRIFNRFQVPGTDDAP